MNPQSLSISTWSIVKVVLVLVGLWFLYFIRDILAIFFVALLLAAIIEPLAAWVAKFHIPRGVAVLLTYIVFFAILTTLIILLIPPVIEQVQDVTANLPALWDRVSARFDELRVYSEQAGIIENIQDMLTSLQGTLSQSARGALATLTSIFGGLISLILVLVITFYIVVEEDALRRIIRSVFPDHALPYLTSMTRRMQERLGGWARGQLILCCIIFVFAFIGLTLVGVKYALLLALLAGFLEFIPYFGPILSAIPIVILAFADGPVRALLALLVFVIIQQVENHVLVPQVMSRAAGLNPVISILALLIGAKLAGPVGMILAIPVATALSVIVQDVVTERKEQ
ncbi:AI-2E family transporter [Candidatus Uhrbacteria bacterium]|nr:AI-2E family transporter [Candidatus Uhrbacteria bacterium]